MRHRHHTFIQRAVNATLILSLTAVVFINRRVQKWVMS